MQRTRAIEFANVVFTSITVRVSLSLSCVNNLFFGGMMANVDINVYIFARENFVSSV